jgi:phosphoribosylanthranilate isomerase
VPDLTIVKASHANAFPGMAALASFAPWVDGFVLDTACPEEDRVGGTGRTHDWTVSRDVVRTASRPVILAGGLAADNVAAAITAVRPYGVDANSRLADASGFKNPRAVAAYVHAARAAFLAARRPGTAGTSA